VVNLLNSSSVGDINISATDVPGINRAYISYCATVMPTCNLLLYVISAIDYPIVTADAELVRQYWLVRDSLSMGVPVLIVVTHCERMDSQYVRTVDGLLSPTEVICINACPMSPRVSPRLTGSDSRSLGGLRRSRGPVTMLDNSLRQSVIRLSNCQQLYAFQRLIYVDHPVSLMHIDTGKYLTLVDPHCRVTTTQSMWMIVGNSSILQSTNRVSIVDVPTQLACYAGTLDLVLAVRSTERGKQWIIRSVSGRIVDGSRIVIQTCRGDGAYLAINHSDYACLTSVSQEWVISHRHL
jgi:hypothetical protein